MEISLIFTEWSSNKFIKTFNGKLHHICYSENEFTGSNIP